MITIINQIKYVLLGKPRTSILLIGVLFLTPSLFLYFVSEDLNFALHLQDSGFLKELKNVWIPTGKFVNQSGLLRPIVETVNLIDYSLWQLNPFGYHLTNAIIHLVNILLVYCFTLQVFNKKQLALSCSLLFLFHPVIANSVYWISGRTDIIACLFYLVSLIFCTNYLERKKNKFLILSCLSFFAALLSKEISITIPLVHIWQIYYWKYIQKRTIDFFKSISIILIFDILIVLIFLLYRFFIFEGNPFTIDEIYHIDSFSHLFINIIKIFSFLIVPFGHKEFELLVYQYQLSLILILIPLGIRIIYLLLRKKEIKIIESALLILIFLTILPLFKLTMRWYMYIPTIPFTMLISFVIYSIWDRTKFVKIFILLYFISIGYGSIAQYNIWLTNSKINKRLVNQLVKKIILEKAVDTFILLNFPAKVNRTATFVAGFEEIIQLHIWDKNKTVIRLVNVIHQNNIEPMNFIINDGKLEISTSNNSYFLLGDFKEIIGVDNLAAGDIISSNICDIKIEEINGGGKATKISTLLNDKLHNINTTLIYFDAESFTYNRLNNFKEYER